MLVSGQIADVELCAVLEAAARRADCTLVVVAAATCAGPLTALRLRDAAADDEGGAPADTCPLLLVPAWACDAAVLESSLPGALPVRGLRAPAAERPDISPPLVMVVVVVARRDDFLGASPWFLS